MKKQEVKSRLEEISGELDCMMMDESIETFPIAFRKTQGKIDELLGEIEDNGIQDDDPTEDEASEA